MHASKKPPFLNRKSASKKNNISPTSTKKSFQNQQESPQNAPKPKLGQNPKQ
jgi:hypothetical protein